ncbi:hypothetical protein SAMN05421593_0561 [Chryseobacterium culicis]|uniref:Uncharacterized protein n=1 Tax=Chryseobacterium culicis TaxID=680127 RepID=A0A1H6GYL1_CHRCI|nr:hypothetical protein SAMN05421593_0561 [Chryseobacterium culicis]
MIKNSIFYEAIHHIQLLKLVIFAYKLTLLVKLTHLTPTLYTLIH